MVEDKYTMGIQTASIVEEIGYSVADPEVSVDAARRVGELGGLGDAPSKHPIHHPFDLEPLKPPMFWGPKVPLFGNSSEASPHTVSIDR